MQQYAVRTTGTFVEDDKVASITWHFGSTNPEFGAMQGKELLNHLKDTMAHLPVDVVMGKSFVRVSYAPGCMRLGSTPRAYQVLFHGPLLVFADQMCHGMSIGVQVRHEGVTKGSLVKHIVSHYNVRGGADFILCLADDRMDEDVFTVLRDYQHDVQYRVYQGDGRCVCCYGADITECTHALSLSLYLSSLSLSLIPSLSLLQSISLPLSLWLFK